MGKKILVVEDERNIVDILVFNLRREGYETLEACDGELGLRLEEGFYMGVFRADYRKDGSVNWYSAVITDDETADFHKPDMLFKAILKK